MIFTRKRQKWTISQPSLLVPAKVSHTEEVDTVHYPSFESACRYVHDIEWPANDDAASYVELIHANGSKSVSLRDRSNKILLTLNPVGDATEEE